MSTPHTLRFDVVIVGGGFTGVYAAKALAKTLGKSAREQVALISDENYMVFQPMLAEVVGSSISPRHVVNPLRRLCAGVTTLRGEIRSIDLANRRLCLNAGAYTHDVEVQFEHLALATGSIVDLSRVPGMPEHAYVLKNVGDALALRATIINRLEEANFQTDPNIVRRLLTFVVVGGGYSGVETAGQVFDLIEGIRNLYPRLADTTPRVIIVHSRDHLLPEVSAQLARYCEETMRARGIELMLGQRVKAMTAGKAILGDGSEIETHTVVSTIGNAPHPLITQLCESTKLPNERGRVLVDGMLRVPGHENLWAAGDCAAVPLGGSRHDDQRPEPTCPPTAQFALRQGDLLGKNIARSMRKEALKTFKFKSLGELAAIGHRSAVAEILGMKFSGFFAWFLWRTIYLAKLPGMERKLRVMLDWTLDLFFPRDINLLQSKPTEVLQEMHLETGDRVFNAGEPALSFYIVKSGCIELHDGDSVVRSLGPGDHFGERALLYDKTWHFTAIAREPTELVAICDRVFESIWRASPSMHEFFERSAARFLTRSETDSLVDAMPARVKSMQVGELMQREPVTMSRTMTLREALEVMIASPYNSFPMVDAENRAIGLVSQGDIYDALKRKDLSPGSTLAEIQPSACASVKPDAAVPDAIERFYRSGRNKLLVVDDAQRLCGILTPIDLLRAK